MKVTPRVQFLNLFREVFRLPGLETILKNAVTGKSPDHFFSKLVPNPYQYPPNTFRTCIVNGIRLSVDISDYLGHILYFGFNGEEWKSYEKLFSLASKDDTILDIGSNIGFTLLSMARISESGMVIGFEPDKLNYERCFKNVNQNGWKNVHVHNIGLGDIEQTVAMEVRTTVNRGGNRVSITGEGESIQIKRLDHLFPSLKIKKIDLIKIDVEGYELNVLKGGEQTLKRFHPTLFIEVNDNNLRDQQASAKSLVEFLFATGYTDISRTDTNEQVTSSLNFSNCHFDIIARK